MHKKAYPYHLARQLGLAFYARNLNLQCVLITQQHENGVNRDGRPSKMACVFCKTLFVHRYLITKTKTP